MLKPCNVLAAMVLLAALLVHPGPVRADLPPGSGEGDVIAQGIPLHVYTYRPQGCDLREILVVMHGVGRDADRYRDYAHSVADTLCLLVIAPLFDKARFPTWRYQFGGITRDGAVQPATSWTGTLIPPLIDWARGELNRPDLPYSVFGHSAGGQFVSRLAAFAPNSARRLIVANPSSHVEPRLDIAPPFGLGHVFKTPERALRDYLSRPVILILGEEDKGSKHLDDRDEAMRQGKNRLERGEAVFAEAQRAAANLNMPLSWRKITLPQVGHSAKDVLQSDAVLDALAR